MRNLKLLNITGLLAYFIGITGIFLCFIVAPEITKNAKFVLSDFGANPETTGIFSTFLVLSAILYFIFLFFFLKKVKISLEFLMLVTFFLSALGLITLTLVPSNISREIHWIGAAIYFLFGAIGIAIVGWSLIIEKRKPIGLFLLFLGVCQIIIVILGAAFITPFALAQLTYIFLTGIWITIISFKL